MKIRHCDDKTPIPIKIKCPKCDGKLSVVDITAWEQDDDRSWYATEISIECEHEPDIESDEWEEWHDWHYDMPYVDWLPIYERVTAAMKRHFRFVGLDE